MNVQQSLPSYLKEFYDDCLRAGWTRSQAWELVLYQMDKLFETAKEDDNKGATQIVEGKHHNKFII